MCLGILPNCAGEAAVSDGDAASARHWRADGAAGALQERASRAAVTLRPRGKDAAVGSQRGVVPVYFRPRWRLLRTPAKAGVQTGAWTWTPACAGVRLGLIAGCRFIGDYEANGILH